jgi:hypothetical protein
MISGTHIVLCSTNAEIDRAFLRDTLGFRHVDAGHGWLIFALPPAEAAIHPAEAGSRHEFYHRPPSLNPLTTPPIYPSVVLLALLVQGYIPR